MDAQLAAEQRKEFRRKAFDAMEQSIDDRFLPVFDQWTSPEDEDEKVAAVLEEALNLAQQLVDIYDLVGPCFPAQDDVFNRLWRTYHRNFGRLVDVFGADAATMDNKGILDVVRWVERYTDTLRGLGIDEEDVKLKSDAQEDGGIAALMAVYIDRDKKSTTNWYLNILDSDIASEPKTDKEGKLWTPGFVDFFRILNDAFAAIERETHGAMLFRSAESAMQMMAEFVEAQMAVLQRDVPMHILCAFCNNNVRSYDLAIEYVEHFDDVVEEEYASKLEAEDVYRGFLEVAKTAMKKLIDGVFSDAGMVGLLKKLYQSEWQSGETTSSLIATLQDYLEEFSAILDDSLCKRVVEAALGKTISSYTTALVTRMPNITEAVIEQMQRDEAQLSAFFTQLMSAEKVAPHIQILSNMRQLACADSVDAFVFAYLSILDVSPETAPSLVEKVCSARPDITRIDANEINEQCRELFHQKQSKRQQQTQSENNAVTSESSASYLSEVRTNLWNKFMGL